MLKILLPIFALLVISLPAFGEPASKPSEAQAQASVLPNEIQVTLNQPDKTAKPWYEIPAITALVGILGSIFAVIAGGFITYKTRHIDIQAADKRLQAEFRQREKESRVEYERKQTEKRIAKQLDELVFIYNHLNEHTLSIAHHQADYYNAWLKDEASLAKIRALDPEKLYEQARTLKEHIDLHLEDFFNDGEDYWVAAGIAHDSSVKSSNLSHSKEMLSAATDAYETLVYHHKMLMKKIAKKSRDLQAINQPSEPSTESKTSSNSPSGSTT